MKSKGKRTSEIPDASLMVASNHISRINSENMHEKWEQLEKEAERKRLLNERMRYYMKERKMSPQEALKLLESELKELNTPAKTQPDKARVVVLDDEEDCPAESVQ